jgi:hypothetical protein
MEHQTIRPSAVKTLFERRTKRKLPVTPKTALPAKANVRTFARGVQEKILKKKHR